ncbi:ATP-binding cassette domain-containing protein [Peptoniphilus sp.]|uniref:ATP-binding cassette domain-containing protein n=1 Tax=Peptoniphilus sp. TaxID=1971214 RepID=UPI0039945A87
MQMFFRNLFYSISIVNSNSKYYVFLSSFNLIFSLILNLMNMSILKFIFDNYNQNINIIIIGLIIYFFFTLLNSLFISWYQNYYLSKENIKLKRKIDHAFFKNIIECKFSILLNPNIYADYMLAINNSTDKILNIYSDFWSIIFNIFNIILVSIMMVSLDVRLFLLCMIFPIINFTLNLKVSQNNYEKEIHLVDANKILKYLDRIFYLNDYVKNLRLYKTKNAIFDLFDSGYDSYEKVNNHYNKKLTTIHFIKNILNLLFSITIISTLTILLYFQKLTVGNFTLIHNTTTNLTGSLSSILDIIPNIYKNSLLLNKYTSFMNITNSSISNKRIYSNTNENKFELQNVSFKFEKSDKYILKNINLKINTGEKVAIIGKNGSGKTTLMHLLLNIYEPSSGNILFNNIDYKKYNNNYFLENCGVLFQNPKIFSFSIMENITMDSISFDKPKIKNSTRIVNLKSKIDSLPDKENTYVSNEINPNGINFSGGELKKIAISRIFQYNFSVVFIDELSTALDNESKDKVLNYLLKSDKTLISITHNLEDAKLFDKIILLDDGKLIEVGSFDELINLRGYFYNIYNK